MKTFLAMMMFVVSAGAFAAGGSTTVYGNTRYCIPSAGGSAQACGAIVNGASVSCDSPPSTGCTIPGVGGGQVGSRQNHKERKTR